MAVRESHDTQEKQADPSSAGEGDAPNVSEPASAGVRSRPSDGPQPEPLTFDVLRRKLDAAIVAEAWDAVKAIRERIVEVERDAAGNVVAGPWKAGGQ
jgi:hypothetical protein